MIIKTDRNMQSFITFTQLKTYVCVRVCFSPPQHGNPSGTDHSKPWPSSAHLQVSIPFATIQIASVILA